MNIWHDINPEKIQPEKFTAVIEISKGSKSKYELDKETGLLNGEATGILDVEATGLLVDENETVALQRNVLSKKRVGGKKLTIIEEVMIIHTDEVIEC